MEESQKREFRRVQRNRIRTVVILLLAALVIGGAAFTYFHITTEARMALREGKNVKLALDMLDIEYYGENTSVYDPAGQDGLKSGVEERVYGIAEQSGRMEILSYDRAEHKILYMVYETGPYRVLYQYDATDGDRWKVEYLITIFDYSDKK